MSIPSVFPPPPPEFDPWSYDFRVDRAENGYIITAKDTARATTARWIANDIDELKDAIITVLVLNRMEGK